MLKIITCINFILFFCGLTDAAAAFDIKNLIPGQLHTSLPRNGYDRLSIYCYDGVSKHPLHFWLTLRLELYIDGTGWEAYIGHSSDDVLREYEARRSSWSWNLPFWRKSDSLYVNPFNHSCIGIGTAQDHSIKLNVIRIDFWRVALLAFGIFIFLTASRLSKTPVFYYSCGISLGVSMSFLVALYFISKAFPKRPAVYAFLAGGWAISVYLVQWLVSNMKMIAQMYQHYVLGYFTIAAIISFIVCYRCGPVSDHRTISLIRWSLQACGLLAVFLSSNYSEGSMAVVILLITYQNFPRSWISAVLNFWHVRFPPKRKILTEDEYHEEGARETIKALDELRRYCSSPECKQWKTVLALKSPRRFAEFIEGQSHLSDEELMEYESDLSKPFNVTDDDSDSSD